MSKTVIIGAGLAGLSAGYHAQQRDLDYEIYEAEAAVGGLCRTIEKDGFQFDYSGHWLHLKDPYFQNLVKNLLGDNLKVVARNTAIYSHGVYTRYPFQANLYGLPAKVIKECLMGFVKAYYENEDLPTNAYRTFRDWIVAKLGRSIGEHFMFPYNKKLWTVPTDTMTCEWLGEYVPKPALEDVFDGAFEDQPKGFGYNATFWYPKEGGIQVLCDAFASKVGAIHLNERVGLIDIKKRVVILESGKSAEYAQVVSTMPLSLLIEKLSGNVPKEVKLAAQKLRHNSILIVHVGVKGESATDKHWIYIPEEKYAAYRVGIYSNVSRNLAPNAAAAYYVEIAYEKNGRVDKEHEIEKAIADMVEIGLIRNVEDILMKDVVDIDCAYVIFDQHYADSRREILDYLSDNHIFSIGRYGHWEYAGMEEAMIQGRDVINQIV